MRDAVRQLISMLAIPPSEIANETFLIAGLTMEYSTRFSHGSESLYEQWIPDELRRCPVTPREQQAIIEALLPFIQFDGTRVSALGAMRQATPSVAIRPLIQVIMNSCESWNADAVHQLLVGLSNCLRGVAGKPPQVVRRELKQARLADKLQEFSKLSDTGVLSDIHWLRKELHWAGL